MDIITALYNHYNHIQQQPIGYSCVKASACLVLDHNGHIVSNGCESLGKTPVSMWVPHLGNRGSSIVPILFADNIDYLAGMSVIKEDNKLTEEEKAAHAIKTAQKLLKRHTAAVDAHNAFLSEIGAFNPTAKEMEVISAVCKFVNDPLSLSYYITAANADKLFTGVCVMRLDGMLKYVHELDVVQRYVLHRFNSCSDMKEQPIGTCMITGKVGPIMLKHEPPIKGLPGDPAGVKLISFNEQSACRQGVQQSLNSPMSRSAVWRYTSTLNWLITNNSVSIDKLTVVVWAADGSKVINDVVRALVNKCPTIDSEQLADLANGKLPAVVDEDAVYYVLGLTVPSKARASVVFWHVDTIHNVFANVSKHMHDMYIDGNEFPTIYQIVSACKRRDDKLAKYVSIAKDLLTSIIYGGPYPDSLFAGVLERIVVDSCSDESVSPLRLAVLRGCYNRRYKKEIAVALDPDRPEPMYQWGRLFAVCCNIQEYSDNRIGNTIKRRFFETATTHPNVTMKQVLDIAEAHRMKIAKAKPGMARYFEKLIAGIIDRIDVLPVQISRDGATMFVLGFYHQLNSRKNSNGKRPAGENGGNEGEEDAASIVE